MSVEPQVCQGCSVEMEEWNAEETEKNAGEESLDEDGDIFIVWSVSDCKTAIFFWCEDCKILQVSHRKCGTPMSLSGHQGFATNGTHHFRDAKTGMTTVLSKPKAFDPNQIRFQTLDLLQTKLRLNEWFACGPDYKSSHFWTCPECDQMFTFNRNK
jgi:hypothetical protein